MVGLVSIQEVLLFARPGSVDQPAGFVEFVLSDKTIVRTGLFLNYQRSKSIYSNKYLMQIIFRSESLYLIFLSVKEYPKKEFGQKHLFYFDKFCKNSSSKHFVPVCGIALGLSFTLTLFCITSFLSKCFEQRVL